MGGGGRQLRHTAGVGVGEVNLTDRQARKSEAMQEIRHAEMVLLDRKASRTELPTSQQMGHLPHQVGLEALPVRAGGRQACNTRNM